MKASDVIARKAARAVKRERGLSSSQTSTETQKWTLTPHLFLQSIKLSVRNCFREVAGKYQNKVRVR